MNKFKIALTTLIFSSLAFNVICEPIAKTSNTTYTKKNGGLTVKHTLDLECKNLNFGIQDCDFYVDTEARYVYSESPYIIISKPLDNSPTKITLSCGNSQQVSTTHTLPNACQWSGNRPYEIITTIWIGGMTPAAPNQYPPPKQYPKATFSKKFECLQLQPPAGQ